jgi:hypothetical protein
MLRGSLILKITKPTKLKAITLKFRGKAVTKWPEGMFSIALFPTATNQDQASLLRRSILRR